jgi:tetratricopeptide (TPR) repeat protein
MPNTASCSTTRSNLPLRLLGAAFLLGAAGPLLGSCASSASDENQDVNWLVRHEQFSEAVKLAASNANARPSDESAQVLHQAASLAYLLDQGRQATFEGNDDRAIEIFELAAEVDPESDLPRQWLVKTHRVLAETWLTRARELHTEGNLDGASEAYENVLTHWPNMPAAITGLARVLKQANYREGQEDELYRSGTRAYHLYELFLARHEYAASGKYATDGERANGRVSEVELDLAQNRIRVAQKLEQDELFSAARNEYRMATLLDPKDQVALDGYARCKVEAQADEMLKDGEMQIRRGLFRSAREILAEGRAKTLTRQDKFDEAEMKIQDAKVESAYMLALDLERDFQYENAIETYRRVLQMRSVYNDTIARLDTLQDYVRDAAELYAEAEASDDSEVKRSKLRQIEIFWREYKDIQRLLAQLGPEPEEEVVEEPIVEDVETAEDSIEVIDGGASDDTDG